MKIGGTIHHWLFERGLGYTFYKFDTNGARSYWVNMWTYLIKWNDFHTTIEKH